MDGGWPEVMARNHALALEAREALRRVLSPEGVPGDAMLGSMVGLPMPADGPLGGIASPPQSSPLETDPLQADLFDRFRIELPIVGWPVPAAERREPPRRVMRVSALSTTMPPTSQRSSRRSR